MPIIDQRDELYKKRRVVITGIGVISPVGIGIKTFWKNILAGKSGIKLIDRFDTTNYYSKIAGQIDDFDSSHYISRRIANRMSRFSQLAIAASFSALEDANFKITKHNSHRVGVLFGTAIGGMDWAEAQHKILTLQGIKKVSPFLAQSMYPGAAANEVAITVGAKGINATVSTGCSSGVSALGSAFKIVQHGLARVVLAGGADAPIIPLSFGSFCRTKELSARNSEPEKASRPFERDRDGFVVSEGAACIVLEELKHAERRHAHIYAELKGFAMTSDAFHMTRVDLNGQQAASTIRYALKDAKLLPEDIEYVSAHGSSCAKFDIKETKILKKVFKLYAYKLPISSIKSMIGHALGASGAFQVVSAALTLKDNHIPPTINYNNPDPECDLDYVPNVSRRASVNSVLINGLGYGGMNSFLILGKYN